MRDICTLRKENGLPDEDCDREACVFWRAVGHLGEERGEGCAIEHFKMLGRDGIAEWLLSVKERLNSPVGKPGSE